MEFRSGDNAVHPSHGVGSILRLEERQLAGAGTCWYYVLAIGSATVWVPLRADGTSSLRAVTSKQALDQYRALLRGRPAALDRDGKQRRLDIAERLKPGSFETSCEVVRDLTALGWERPINEADGALLKKVRDNMCREWAVAADVDLPEAVQEISELLLAGRVAYKA